MVVESVARENKRADAFHTYDCLFPNNITTDIRAHIMGSLGFTRRLYSSGRVHEHQITNF
jgi:hypothetical protein